MNEEQYNKYDIVIYTVESPPSFAGAGINAYNFAKYLSTICRSVFLCHLNYNNRSLQHSRDDKLKIRKLPYYNKNLLVKIISFPGLLFNYFRFSRKGKIIFIYGSYLVGYQFIILFSRLLNKKIVFRSTLLDGDDAMSLVHKNLFLSVFNKFCLKQISLYYSINPEFTERFKHVFGNQKVIFESIQGVNTSRFYPPSDERKKYLREKFGLPPDGFIIFSVGFLIKRKGFEPIMRALQKLAFPFRYIIAGEYEPSPYHRTTPDERIQMTELLKIGPKLLVDKIVFAGPVDNIEEYFQLSDIFIHGSESEGTPNALLEAMACGLPCLVKRLKGISNFLLQHQMNAIEFLTYEELPDIINFLKASPQRASDLGHRAYITITENYTFEKVAKNLFRSLNECP